MDSNGQIRFILIWPFFIFRRELLWEFTKKLQARGLIAQVTDEPEIRELINNGGARFISALTPLRFAARWPLYGALPDEAFAAGRNKPVVLLGGGTGFIGDPIRQNGYALDDGPETIQHNCDPFFEQIGSLIELARTRHRGQQCSWLLI
jgi:tyrosyl-tRNA synthetase